MWTLRDARRTSHEEDSIHDSWILAAAQWILWNGQSFFKQVLFLSALSSVKVQSWPPGSLCDGRSDLPLHRWHFWSDRFRDITGENRVINECKTVSWKVLDMMILVCLSISTTSSADRIIHSILTHFRRILTPSFGREAANESTKTR